MPLITVKIASHSYDIPVQDHMVEHVKSLAESLDEKARYIESQIQDDDIAADYLILLSCITMADELWEENQSKSDDFLQERLEKLIDLMANSRS